jgi:hypothetical protein
MGKVGQLRLLHCGRKRLGCQELEGQAGNRVEWELCLISSPLPVTEPLRS